jgi:long-chain acyl-CoA synthetase
MHPGTFAATTPDKPAIIMAGTGETVTYRQLDDRANRVSQLFATLGLAPGDHIAFQVGNRPVFHEILWGAHRAGLVYTAISTRLGAEETAYIVENCDAAVMIADAAQTSTLAALAPNAALEDRAGAETPHLRGRYVIGGDAPGWDRWEEAVATQPAVAPEAAFAGDDMLYSSGTTGRPKGIFHPVGGATLADADGVVILCQLLFGVTDATVYLSPAPLYHSAPLRFTRAIHRTGGTVVVMEHFDAAEYLDLVGRYRVTHSQVVPTMFIRLLKLAEDVRAAADVSSLETIIHAAAPCPAPVKRQMIDWWGPILWEYYAGTEGNGLVICNSEQWLAHPGTVGAPLNCEVHIVGEDGVEKPVGESGTIYFAGGSDFEYHGDPVKTAEAHLAQGWATLGDVGCVDADNFLYLTDRKANMIISGGVNIYPQEAENLLALHPKVADVAVFGVPDEEMGEQVKAVVQPVDWSEAGPALEAELIAYCRAHLAHLKCPKSVDFDAELPRHPTGKLYKRLVKDRYWEGRATRIGN